jgi:aarF domain-containing kinase
MKFAQRAALGTLAGLGGYIYYKREDRTLTLWTKIGPVLSHYRAVELKHKLFPVSKEQMDADYSKLHNLYSDQVFETFLHLRGFYVKIGQVLANRPDLIPSLYIEKLRKLEDQVPPSLSGLEARAVICQSLHLESIDSQFLEFDDIPIGSASIGQVHKARLISGKLVALKIQSPGAEKLFRHDITRARDFCKVFAPEQVILFDEIEKQFMTEFDYQQEAHHLETVRKNMQEFRDVVVPKPYLHLCSKEVLTMEYLSGPKLIDGIRENGRHYAKTLGKTYEELESEYRANFDANGFPPAGSGATSFQLNVYRSLLMSRDFFLNLPVSFGNLCIAAINMFGFELQYLQPFKSFIPLNSAFIMETLLEAHGKQILVDGYFNADPHPGNFLLLENNKIGLIDYGQVKQLSEQERFFIAKVIVALANKEKDKVAELALELGHKSKFSNREVIYRMNVVALDQDGHNTTDGLNIQQFVDKMFKTDPWISISPIVIMPTRVSLLLRGLGLMLNHPVSVAAAWKHIAEQVVSQYSESN